MRGSSPMSFFSRPWWFFSNSLYPRVTYSLPFSSVFTTKESFRNSRRPSLPLRQKWRLTSRYTYLWSATGLSIARVPLSYSLAMSPARTASLCFVRSRPSCRSLRIFPKNTWLASLKGRSCIRFTWRMCGAEVKYRFNPERIFVIELREYSLPSVPRAHA